MLRAGLDYCRQPTPDESVQPLLQASRLSVRFGTTAALNEVDLELFPGEVHAVVGENGAGKSTLIRCLAGMLSPTSGHIERDPSSRVAWVPQEPDLPTDLTVREWIFLGEEWRNRFHRLNKREMDRAARNALQEIGANFDAPRRLATLTAAQRKQVQLARAIRQGAHVLLLDEPTAVLGARETDALFTGIHRQRERGGIVLYVSHRLEEVKAIADRVTVLRDGRRIATTTMRETTIPRLIDQMVGRVLPTRSPFQRVGGEPVLQVRGLSVAHLRDASVDVASGEIVGLAGLLGAGRSELIESVAGIRRPLSGTIECAGPMALLAEDRGSKGLVRALDLRSNIFLPSPTRWLRHAAENNQATEWIRRLRIRADGPDARIESLSGGNQQKVLLARALRQSPRLLLLDEPTAGVDIGAKAEIHDLIREQAQQGTAVLVASSDMPELLNLSDRIIALYEGRCVGTFDTESTSESELAASITGAATAHG